MGEHGSDYPGVLACRSRGPMLRCGCRTAKGIHGEALEIGHILAGASNDVWVAHHEPLHLVDDHTADLVRKSHVRRLRHRH